MHTTTALHATPKHIAIIMDGNRRWAAKHKLSTLEGHRRGAEVAGQIIEACGKNNIAYLTLYVFSTENFQRPPAEVAAMMELLQRYIDTKLSSLLENNVVLKISGNLSYMPSSLQKSLAKAVATTKDNTGLNLILALGYSSQEEITLACQQIALKVQKGDSLTIYILQIFLHLICLLGPQANIG